MEPVIFVIFGASGDLSRRKLIPALFALHKTNSLPDNFLVLGVSRTEYSDEAFRENFFINNDLLSKEGSTNDQQQSFAKRLFYQSINTLDEADYIKVKKRLQELDERFQLLGNYIFYLSTPPELYNKIPAYLSFHGLNNANGGWKRLVIEKPFGYDRASAIQLNRDLQQYFQEDQIYRIDHYLGKETVQNLLVTRFANGIYEPLWNRNYIHHVEITAAENLGVGNRGGYYDKSGALRDMLQNHLMQIVAHVAMEPPVASDARSIRNEKVKLFQSLRPITAEEVSKYTIRGQYISSRVRGELVKGYRDEEGVPDDSKTETYVALNFFIDNWRWADVPFYIRTGKRLPTKVTEVTVTFKHPPHHLFKDEDQPLNQLILRIQPDEGLLLKFGMKVPGAGFSVKNVGMDFHYSDLTDTQVPEAYERLLLDCVKGDATLYARGDSVEEAWAFVEPILDAWENDPSVKIYGYPAGTWGPDIANKMIADINKWRDPCKNLTSDDNYCEL